MSQQELQLLVFDTRRGNQEGEEGDKLLAFFPPAAPPVHQSGLAGLLQGLLLFTASFTAGPRPRWDVAETDSGTWVLHEPEPHIWFAALAPRAWLPRHATQHNLRCLLVQAHLLAAALTGGVQAMLDEDPSGGLARRSLAAVLQRLGQQLGSTHSWQHRELRNPLADASLPPQLQLSPAGALATQSLANQLLHAAVAGQRPVRGALLLYGPHLLWSSLPARDTAAVFALIATGLLHASPSANSSSAGAAMPPHLRALDGGCWQQVPSGFLVLRGSPDAAPIDEHAAAAMVPQVYLQHSPHEQQQEQQQQEAQQQQAWPDSSSGSSAAQPHHLLPLLEGKLLVALLLDAGTPLSPQLLAALHALLAAPAKALAAQVGEELRAARVEAGHLPGFRFLHQDAALGLARASPRGKVSAMSHHARTLAAAVRDSLAAAAPAPAAAPWQEGSRGGASADCQDGGSPQSLQQQQHCSDEVLEVLAKSSQDCWAAGWRPGGGRQLLAVRERRTERELPEAGEVMQAFAAQHFYI